MQEEFEDTKGVIRIHKSRDRQHMDKRKSTKDIQRSTKQTHKTNDRVTRTPLKTGDELMCSAGVNSSCSISGTCRVNLDTVISHEWGEDPEVVTARGKYPWSFVAVNQVMVTTVELSKWWLQRSQEDPLVQ